MGCALQVKSVKQNWWYSTGWWRIKRPKQLIGKCLVHIHKYTRPYYELLWQTCVRMLFELLLRTYRWEYLIILKSVGINSRKFWIVFVCGSVVLSNWIRFLLFDFLSNWGTSRWWWLVLADAQLIIGRFAFRRLSLCGKWTKLREKH